jgi:hypothetical protein
MKYADFGLVALGLLLAPILWGARGRVLEAGATIDEALTLITADKHDLSCALAVPVGIHRCHFRAPSRPFREKSQRASVLQPFVSLAGETFLISGLFDEPALARRYAAEVPDGRPRGQYRRFVAHCRLKLLARVSSVAVQFGQQAAFRQATELWAAEPVTCHVSE